MCVISCGVWLTFILAHFDGSLTFNSTYHTYHSNRCTEEIDRFIATMRAGDVNKKDCADDEDTNHLRMRIAHKIFRNKKVRFQLQNHDPPSMPPPEKISATNVVPSASSSMSGQSSDGPKDESLDILHKMIYEEKDGCDIDRKNDAPLDEETLFLRSAMGDVDLSQDSLDGM